MARKCSICSHASTLEINRLLIGEVPLREIAEKFSVSIAALDRHRHGHIPPTLPIAAEGLEQADAEDLLTQLKQLQVKTERVLEKAEAAENQSLSLKAIKEARSNLELLAKLQGQIAASLTINFVESPQYVEVRAIILNALESHPAARLTVANALQDNIRELPQ